MMDFMGGFRGNCLHMETANATASDVYTVYTTAKAKTPEGATAIVEILKSSGSAQCTSEPGFLRSTVLLVGGDLPPQFQDQVTLRWVQQWKSAADYEASKTPAAAESAATIKELVDEFTVVEYAATNHYAQQ